MGACHLLPHESRTSGDPLYRRTAVKYFNCSSHLSQLSPPSSSDLHFNVRGEISGMLLEGVRMINHLKSKILITGCNFCYLRTPLVSGKEGKNTTGYSLQGNSRVGREGGKGGGEEMVQECR